jgi:hypothetical protein
MSVSVFTYRKTLIDRSQHVADVRCLIDNEDEPGLAVGAEDPSCREDLRQKVHVLSAKHSISGSIIQATPYDGNYVESLDLHFLRLG